MVGFWLVGAIDSGFRGIVAGFSLKFYEKGVIANINEGRGVRCTIIPNFKHFKGNP